MKKIILIFVFLFALVIAPSVANHSSNEVTKFNADGNENANPLATADQVTVDNTKLSSYGDNLPTGMSFEDGLLTIGADYTGISISVVVSTGDSSKADLTIIVEKNLGSGEDAGCLLYNQSGNLTLDGHGRLITACIWAEGDLVIKGKVAVDLMSNPGYFNNYDQKGMVYVGEKLSILDSGTLSGYLRHSGIATVCTKYLEIDTTSYVRISCSSTSSRCVVIAIHDCNSLDALAERLIYKKGDKFELAFSNADENKHQGIIAYGTQLKSLNLDAEYKFFIDYDIEIETDEERTKLSVVNRQVEFYQNGGTGTYPIDEYPTGKSIILPECPYTAPEGMRFKGYAIGSLDATPLKKAGDELYIEKSDSILKVYAIWEKDASPLTGTVAITGFLKYGETLTASITDTNNTGSLSYQWRRNGDDIVSATDSTYVVTASDIGYTLSVVVTSSIETGSIVATTSNTISKATGRDAPMGLSAVSCTTDANDDGVINGVSTDMEFKLSTDTIWTKVDSTSLTGLMAGTYNIRYQETDTHEAGEIANVVVNAFNAPIMYAITVNNGTSSVVSCEAGTIVTINANAPEIGKVFAGWTTSDGIEFVDATSLSTTFVMIEKNVTIRATYKDEATPEEVAPVTPNKTKGLPAGAVVAIVIGSILIVGVASFAVVWFIIKKKTWADFLALFKKGE